MDNENLDEIISRSMQMYSSFEKDGSIRTLNDDIHSLYSRICTIICRNNELSNEPDNEFYNSIVGRCCFIIELIYEFEWNEFLIEVLWFSLRMFMEIVINERNK